MSESPTGLAAQRVAHALRDHERTGLGGVDEHRHRGDVAQAEHRVALAERAPRHRAERGERLVGRGLLGTVEPVELPEHHRDRLHLAPGGGDNLLDQHWEVALAEETGDRIDLPVVGVGTGRETGHAGVPRPPPGSAPR